MTLGLAFMVLMLGGHGKQLSRAQASRGWWADVQGIREPGEHLECLHQEGQSEVVTGLRTGLKVAAELGILGGIEHH